MLKVSLITVVFNGEKYLKECFESVITQNYSNIEFIVVDGMSTDSTLNIIENHKAHIHHFISEKDKGMYDALNKGINMATGDIVGILNADDMLAAENVISLIVDEFTKDPGIDGVYGNLNYISPAKNNQIIRKWRTKQYQLNDINYGWMPAHPTLYLRRNLFSSYGGYSLAFGTAADYELMLRYLYVYKLRVKFLNYLIVNMRTGGMSNASLKLRWHAFVNDYKALKINGLRFPLLTVILKKIIKLKQFLQ